MSQQPDNTTAAGRLLIQEAQLRELDELRGTVHSLRQTALDDNELEALGIRKLPAIDVDEIAPFDPEPSFFRPYPLDDTRDFPTIVDDALIHHQNPYWKRPCKTKHCNCVPCAGFRAEWFIECFGVFDEGIKYHTEWWGPSGELCEPEIDGCRLDWHVSNCGHPNAFRSAHVFRVTDDRKPHTTMMVLDGAINECRTLSSEVLTAISVLQYRLRHKDFVNHHTIPVLVYGLQGDKFARISQAYWDGASLVIRQSRLLDFRRKRPTADAYILLRWIANKPVGETEYQPIQDNVSDDEAGRPQPLAETLTVQS